MFIRLCMPGGYLCKAPCVQKCSEDIESDFVDEFAVIVSPGSTVWFPSQVIFERRLKCPVREAEKSHLNSDGCNGSIPHASRLCL